MLLLLKNTLFHSTWDLMWQHWEHWMSFLRITMEFLVRQDLFSVFLITAKLQLVHVYWRNGWNNLLLQVKVILQIYNFLEIQTRLDIVDFLFQNEHIRKDIQSIHLRTVYSFTNHCFSFLTLKSYMLSFTECRLKCVTMPL